MSHHSESFDNIYLDLSKESGKCRFAENGFGWKPSGGGETFTLDQSNIGSAQWSRASKGYEIRILQRNSGIIQLDGFVHDDFDRLSKIFKNWYSSSLENKEHALRGWNWGKADFAKAELSFNVQNKPAFELPYSEIGNTNLTGRNEVAVEMALPQDSNDTGTENTGGARGKGKKAGAGKDQLVEMRFYIPGVITTKKEADGEAGSDAGEEEEQEQNAATLFYDTLIDKAEIGEMAGDTIATFLDVLHLTPRYGLRTHVDYFHCYLCSIVEVVSISTCTRLPSDSVARRTTTRYNTMLLKSSWCFPSPMRCTVCCVSASTLLCARVKQGTLSWLCSSRRTRKLPLI